MNFPVLIPRFDILAAKLEEHYALKVSFTVEVEVSLRQKKG